MPTKAELYAQMADKVATQLTGSWQEWAGFLTTASRLYKYPFHEQLMIYAQRPDATACAEYDLWNEKMGRYVRRGSKGIALVDDSGDRPRLRYVFDISDTGTREHSHTPWLWQLEERHLDSVQVMLERTYDVSGDDLAGQLTEVAGKLAEEYWTEHQQDFFYIVDGSFLEEYDEYNIGVQFKAAATGSITYALMSRCGLEPERYFDHEDFMAIFDFNTPSTIGALGTAVSQINQQVLRQIGVTVRNAEREANQERSKQDEQSHDLYPERRLSDSRPEAEPAAGETPGQVRKDEENLPQGTPSHPLQPDVAEREAVPAPSGDRRDRPEQTGADDAPAGEGSGSHRGTESQRSYEVGGADEHLQSPGRGNPDGGAYQQLTLNLFLSEAEQIQSIDEAENVAHTSSAFSFAQNDIDHVLRLGGNTDRQRERVVAAFEKQKTTAEIAEILKTLYHGGNGLGSVSAWYAEDGIHLSHGKSVRYDRSAQVISWESAAKRIGELLESGQFASNVELAEAAGYERSLLSEKLWYLYHDLSEDAREARYLSCLSEIKGNGFPEETHRLTEQLSEPDFRQTLKEEYAAFWTAYQQDRDLLRFHYHRPREIWESLKELDLPRRTFSSDLSPVPTVQHFITEDEIDAAMTGGSSFAGGKGRIYAFFMENHTDKEKVRFLKDEYGIGGRSHALSGATHSGEDHDGKGLHYKKQDCPDVHLNWEKVAKRITSLVQKGRYLTEQEQAQYDKIQAEKELAEEDAIQAQQPEVEEETPKPTLREQFEQYKPVVTAAISEDAAYRNACGHSDRENAVIEGNAAVRRAVLASKDMELIRLYSDVPEFRQRLHREVIDETYPKLHELLRPLSQEDIDTALCAWNGNIESKHAVVRYMKDHAREKDTAAWLAQEYGGSNSLFVVRAGSPEETQLPWPKVQRRLAQLIQEDRFYTEEEQDRFDNIDPITIREALEERGIVNGQVADPEKLDNDPFIQQVMSDVEQIIAAETEQPSEVSISDEEYDAVRRPTPQRTSYDPAAPVYAVGDTVYIEDDAYQITELRDDTVQLLPTGMAYPIYRAERKADMFTKRTIKPHQAVAVVDTASEALAVSISEKACVDMGYMSQLTGKTKEELAGELQGVIFRVPGQLEQDGTPHYVTADEYLSGNVRRKLRQAQRAAQQDPSFAVNVEALTAAQPKDLDASEIEVRLGATWIDKEYIQQFMYETFNTPFYLQRSIEVNYSSFTAEWQIKGKSSVSYNDVAAYTTYGTSRANAYKILEDSLNLRDVRIYDTIEDADGKERRVLNAKETTLAAQKQQAIREAFKDWIWRDPERRQTLVRQYNEEMNSTRPREYDGSHITFGGMNPAITLREHQKSAIAHVLYGGNTLLAHEVGAGKTFEMVAAAMEAKRLGLCQKSLFVVPNHLTEQWASEFLRLYPSANILVTTKKDFETHNRKKFCARIATGDYDAIIMGHSQFERIPISRERQERLLYEQIDEITEGIAEVQASGGERFTVKQLERTRKSLEARLEKLQAEGRKDDVVTFEQLGVDRLFVDEAHNYKNLFLYTKMRNVAGLSTSDAQKSSDMFAKCRYMDEITGNRGVIFATGTPVSNSMTELYTMQRYLQYERLQELNMTHFDCWASRFGETVTALELAPEGTGYRARTRFSKFFNLPELMNLFKEVADIKTADQLNLPTPEVEYHNIVAQPTGHQKEMVKALSERASLVHSGSVDPSQDNMLKITSDGRKLGLDQRIVNQMLPDEPGTKVNQCVDNIMQIWRDGEADKLTQLVFCDISTPQAKAPASKAAKTLDNPLLHALEGAVPLPEQEPAFTVYDDIRQKLIAQGMPADQIAFIHEANTEVRKKELFSKVRTGQVRVLMGSTAKMGAGTNVQDRLVALHDLDCPWRPGDLAQRKGRIERQGNQNPLVHVYRYVTEGTFDAYLWQTVENKQKFISQIMTSKSPVRSCDDVDETALSFAEIKALCAGDPRIKERMDLDVEVSRLKLMKADHQSKQYRLEDQLLKYFPEEIEKHKGFIKGFESDLEVLAAHPHPEDGFAGMEIRGDLLTDKENAGAALLDACKEVKTSDPVQIGSYRGYAMSVEFSAWKQEYTLLLKEQMTHRATLGTDPRGNLTRIDNALAQMPQRLEAAKAQLDNLYQQQAAAKEEVGKPFLYEEELKSKNARLVELDTLLNIDGKGPAHDEAVVAKNTRPSVLDHLKRPVPPRSTDKKPKQHEEVR